MIDILKLRFFIFLKKKPLIISGKDYLVIGTIYLLPSAYVSIYIA